MERHENYFIDIKACHSGVTLELLKPNHEGEKRIYRDNRDRVVFLPIFSLSTSSTGPWGRLKSTSSSLKERCQRLRSEGWYKTSSCDKYCLINKNESAVVSYDAMYYYSVDK